MKRFGRRDGLLVAVVCVAWAGNFLFSKVALREFPPLICTALRLGGVQIIALLRLAKTP